MKSLTLITAALIALAVVTAVDTNAYLAGKPIARVRNGGAVVVKRTDDFDVAARRETEGGRVHARQQCYVLRAGGEHCTGPIAEIAAQHDTEGHQVHARQQCPHEKRCTTVGEASQQDDTSAQGCNPGALTCSDDLKSILRCDALGNWAFDSTCPANYQCNGDGKGYVFCSVPMVKRSEPATGFCHLGDYTCSADRKSILRCNAPGDWGLDTTCACNHQCAKDDNGAFFCMLVSAADTDDTTCGGKAMNKREDTSASAPGYGEGPKRDDTSAAVCNPGDAICTSDRLSITYCNLYGNWGQTVACPRTFHCSEKTPRKARCTIIPGEKREDAMDVHCHPGDLTCGSDGKSILRCNPRGLFEFQVNCPRDLMCIEHQYLNPICMSHEAANAEDTKTVKREEAPTEECVGNICGYRGSGAEERGASPTEECHGPGCIQPSPHAGTHDSGVEGRGEAPAEECVGNICGYRGSTDERTD